MAEDEAVFNVSGGEGIAIYDLPAKLRLGSVCSGTVAMEFPAETAAGLARVIERGIRVGEERAACDAALAEARADRREIDDLLAETTALAVGAAEASDRAERLRNIAILVFAGAALISSAALSWLLPVAP